MLSLVKKNIFGLKSKSTKQKIYQSKTTNNYVMHIEYVPFVIVTIVTQKKK